MLNQIGIRHEFDKLINENIIDNMNSHKDI